MLSDAISESSEASEQLRALRDEGYSLYLLLDGERSPRPAAVLRTDRPVPSFRLDRSDVVFLRSVGIDPTRPPARRRNG